MISIPIFSSALLLLAVLVLSADGRSTTPWNRRFPTLASKTPQTSVPLMLPQIRGGETSSSDPSSTFSTVPSSESALPTPASSRIGDTTSVEASEEENAETVGETPDASSYKIHPSITGGHILRAGKVDPADGEIPKAAAAAPAAKTPDEASADVVVETIVTKKPDKATKKILKRHKQIAKKLKNRNATNKRRKFMHFCWGMLFASLNHFVPRQRFVPIMTTVSTLTLLMEMVRYRKGFEWINNTLHFVLGKALRKHEMEGKFTGSFYYFAGVTLTSYLYPKSCATLGIVQLAIADPTASFFGRATRHVYWSRIGNGIFGLGRNKGILGFLGGAVSCVPLNYRLLSLALAKKSADVAVPFAKPTILAVSLALGAAGAFADLLVPTPAWTLPKTIAGVKVPPLHLDDNVAIPVLSGWACVKIFAMAGIATPPAELSLAKYLVV